MSTLTVEVNQDTYEALKEVLDKGKAIQTRLVEGAGEWDVSDFNYISIAEQVQLWENIIDEYDSAVSNNDVNEEGVVEVTVEYGEDDDE